MGAAGGCLCGGVRYEIRGDLTQPVACHCAQCARTSGHFAAMTCCKSEDLTLIASETLVWFRSSAAVARGFCARCGGNLFWREDPGTETYVTVGTLDRPTGLKLAGHIYVGSKSDYYELGDGLPQKQEW
ncbi:GFA family protein [Roseixanthobacter pseudopolyaromaticivorans]|uniref:GFA family protein n=1 Tax=Xanthobacteraceae TaxID=335928 RepID=UPI00372715E1